MWMGVQTKGNTNEKVKEFGGQCLASNHVPWMNVTKREEDKNVNESEWNHLPRKCKTLSSNTSTAKNKMKIGSQI
jgi:hypothetical protein